MLEILQTLRDTPLPIILVIGGLIFLLIPFIQTIVVKEAKVETTNKFFAGFIGFILLIIGIGLYVTPPQTVDSILLTQTPPSIISITETPQVEMPTLTQTVLLPQPSATIQQPVTIPTEILPTFTPDPNCMTITMFREMGKNNETKTYVRCPVGQIQYSIQIDDVLNSMVLSCPGQPDKNISFSKNQARSDGELLITVDSEVFRSEQGCKVYLTITNSIAEMGYTVWQEVIAP